MSIDRYMWANVIYLYMNIKLCIQLYIDIYTNDIVLIEDLIGYNKSLVIQKISKKMRILDLLYK